jgi:hypothetical protein
MVTTIVLRLDGGAGWRKSVAMGWQSHAVFWFSRKHTTFFFECSQGVVDNMAWTLNIS